MQFAARTESLIASPIAAAFGLLDERVDDRPLLDLSQAAPGYPPAPAVMARMAEAALDPRTARYGPQPGLPELRDALADDLSAAYGSGPGSVTAADVLISAGCNQAFCLAINALAGPGDSVVLAVPYYFNHDMWLRVEGIEPRHLAPDTDHLPDPERAEALLDDTSRAIVLVSPGNPTGVTIPPERIVAFAELARRRGVALILDETYRSFRPTTEPAHPLFADPAWRDVVVSLHSFSKDLAIPGHRVGAVVGGADLLFEAQKILDCVAISATQMGQEAAITGLRECGEWRVEQRTRVAALQASFDALMATRPGGFEPVTSGAYFGWVRFPQGDRDESTAAALRRLVVDHDVLAIPGTAFTPTDERLLRLSFANLDEAGIAELGPRLAEFSSR